MKETKLPSESTLPKGTRWTHEHDIFQVIFEKANRIGENKSKSNFFKSRPNGISQDINFITPEKLDEAIQLCYKNIAVKK